MLPLDWHVLLVRLGHEMQVQRLVVERRGVESYVPFRSEVRQLSDRRRVARLPPFTGYTFVRGNLQDSGQLVTLPGVIGFLRIGGGLATVTAAEMDTVRTVSEKCVTVETWNELKPGRRIRILSGALTGCEGEIVMHKSGSFFTIRLSLLGRQIATPLDLSQTEVTLLGEGGGVL